jgi:uncharacterized membrane protein YdbT with pleckstrin-like domain
MARYVDSVLAEGEQVVYSTGLSHWNFFLHYLFGVLFLAGAAAAFYFPEAGQAGPPLAIAACVAALVLIGYAAVKRTTTELALTNRRIIAKHGLVARDTIEMSLAKVESLRVTQSLLGRVLNFGDVTVVGTGTSIEPIRGIANPLELRKRLGEIA